MPPMSEKLEIPAPETLGFPKPKMQFSELDNGIRIVSIDKFGLASNVSLFVHAGSRYETPEQFGASHICELMAWKSTQSHTQMEVVKELELLGANATCQSDREHICYNVESLREHLPIVVPLITNNVLRPRLLESELLEAHARVPLPMQHLENVETEQFITELLMRTAFKGNTVGHARYCDPAAPAFTEEQVRSYMEQHYAPERIVMVGVNVDHLEFCKLVEQSFRGSDLKATPRNEAAPIYTGGYMRMPCQNDLAHVAVAFPTDGWQSQDLAALTVLQTLLGGAYSFSTGGPGKGMQSRLYTNVLNNYRFMESAVAFNQLFSDSGIFGLYMRGVPGSGGYLQTVAANEFAKLHNFTQEEVSRSKNALKSSVFMNLENRTLVAEDTGRQLLMAGKVASGSDFAAMINQVQAKDLTRVAKKMLRNDITVVAYGQIDDVQPLEDFRNIFRRVEAILPSE